MYVKCTYLLTGHCIEKWFIFIKVTFPPTSLAKARGAVILVPLSASPQYLHLCASTSLNYSYMGNPSCFFTGYKLKPFGFPIHGAVDGFSRKVLWVEVTKSNNLPETVAKLYFDCVRQHKGCPLQTRTDCGTENGMIAAASSFFWNLSP